MKKIGLLIEIKDHTLKPSNFGMITAARAKGHVLYALIINHTVESYQEELRTYGVDKVIDISIDGFRDVWHPVHWTEAVVAAVQQFGIEVLFGLSSGRNRDLLPRIAAALDAPLIMDCIKVDVDRRTAETSQFSGKAVATFRVNGPCLVFGLRPNQFEPVPEAGPAEIISFSADAYDTKGMETIPTPSTATDVVDLTEAEIIIAGGRGMENGEKFSILFECAKKLNAAVGASRAAVDAGWVPYALQVGQTGTKVNPKVYIACGISGSVQHFAGMKTAGRIIAINTDPEAAIIAKCDNYIIADLFEVIPALTRQLAEMLMEKPDSDNR